MTKNYITHFINRIRFRKTIKSDESNNVVAGMAKARVLYKEFIAKAHPDRHPDNADIAEELTKRINENRYCYSELLKLKTEFTEKLQ